MSASLQTTNYNFPKFAGADKPAWLVDFNGAMDAIDASLKTISDLLNTVSGESGDLSDTITAIQTNVTTLLSDVSTLQGVVATNVLGISTNTTDIANLQTDKASKPLPLSSSLLASAWVGSSAPYTLDLSVEGVTSTSIQFVNLPNGITSQQFDAFSLAKIVDNGQSAGVMSFKAYGVKPTIDLPISILKAGEPHA